jgi:DNA-binding LacI/PurR family transcriptional regulator
MSEAQATLKDIAKRLGLSVSTVSRALKKHPDINPETRNAVEQVAKELNYQPNAIALSLLKSKTFIIGLVIPEIVHHFFSSVISGIEEVAYNAGYRVMICQSNESYHRELENIHTLVGSRVDGMIISMTKETSDFEHFKAIEKSNVPMVFFDRICPALDTDRVIINDYKASLDAVQHLINIGRKKIMHFAGPQNLQIGKLRLEGYFEAHKKNKLPIDHSLIIQCDTYESAILETNKIIESGNLPDAIFAVNDMTAVGALKVLHRKDIKVPEQIAVVGFTNGIISLVCQPALTTVEQNGFSMGQKAAELLIDRIEKDKHRESKIVQIPTSLIVRRSSDVNAMDE